MTANATPSKTPGIVRLPIWAIALLLVLGLLSVLFAPGTIFTIMWLGLFAVSIYGVWTNFSAEVKRLRASHAVTGQTLDKDKLKSDAREALPVPLWLAVVMGVGVFWAVVVMFKVLGFFVGLIIFLALVVAVIFGGYLAYKELKNRGTI